VSSKFGHEQLKVVYTDGAPEFHATEDRQVHDEDLIWSLFNPMLALFLLTKPVERTVPRTPEIDDAYKAEMKSLIGEKAMPMVEFFALSEKLDLEHNPTRQKTSFPVQLIGLDNMPLEGHAGLEFLKEQLSGRETVTVADIEEIAANWKAR
jgi:hypothetical protein